VAGAGTGYPYTLRCAKCKRGRDWRSLRETPDTRLEATGRVKRLRGQGLTRCVPYLAEYRCLRCGHVGWSKHEAMKGLLKKAGFEVVFDDDLNPMVQRVMDLEPKESGCKVFREDAIDHDCDGWVDDDDEWFPGAGGIIDSENM